MTIQQRATKCCKCVEPEIQTHPNRKAPPTLAIIGCADSCFFFTITFLKGFSSRLNIVSTLIGEALVISFLWASLYLCIDPFGNYSKRAARSGQGPGAFQHIFLRRLELAIQNHQVCGRIAAGGEGPPQSQWLPLPYRSPNQHQADFNHAKVQLKLRPLTKVPGNVVVPKNVPRTKRWVWENHLFKHTKTVKDWCHSSSHSPFITFTFIPVSQFLSHFLAPPPFPPSPPPPIKHLVAAYVTGQVPNRTPLSLICGLLSLLNGSLLLSHFSLSERHAGEGGRQGGRHTHAREERERCFNYSYLSQVLEKKKKNGSAMKGKERPGVGERRGKSRPKWWGIPRAVEIQGCASLGP